MTRKPTTRKYQNSPKETSLEAYERNQDEIKHLLKKIEVGLEKHDHKGSASAGGHHWGFVEDLADIKSTLQDLSDRLHDEGEYTPEKPPARRTR